jgi:HTH-type transcriptional regulator/antitoxin HigA
MEIKPIRSDADHDEMLREIERLWGAAPNTHDGDRLDILITLSEAWERIHVPMPLPSAIEAIRFRLEQLGLDQKALIGVIGTRSRVYEVMKGDRPLTLAMIKRLSSTFGISAEVLIQQEIHRDEVA